MYDKLGYVVSSPWFPWAVGTRLISDGFQKSTGSVHTNFLGQCMVVDALTRDTPQWSRYISTYTRNYKTGIEVLVGEPLRQFGVTDFGLLGDERQSDMSERNVDVSHIPKP